jgi:hypothetical protein
MKVCRHSTDKRDCHSTDKRDCHSTDKRDCYSTHKSDCYSNGSIKSEGKKDAVSAFGSITAQLMDGMAMSLSQFGETGECDEGMNECIKLQGYS